MTRTIELVHATCTYLYGTRPFRSKMIEKKTNAPTRAAVSCPVNKPGPLEGRSTYSETPEVHD